MVLQGVHTVEESFQMTFCQEAFVWIVYSVAQSLHVHYCDKLKVNHVLAFASAVICL